MEFWRLVQRPKRHQNLVVKLMRDLESGYFAVPTSYGILTSYRTEPLLPARFAAPTKVQLPEQPRMKRFLKEYPEARTEPVALGSFKPSLARQFTQRQTVIANGPEASCGDPFRIAEQQLAEPLARMRRRALGEVAVGGASPLEFLQQQEQEQLDAGMRALAEGQELPALPEAPRAQGGGRR